MSTVITISGWPRQNDFVPLVREWLCGRVPGLRIERAVIHRRYWRRDRMKIPEDDAAVLAKLIEKRDLFRGDEAMVIDCVQAFEGHSIGFSMTFVGREFEAGRAWRVDGHAAVKLPHKGIAQDLERSLKLEDPASRRMALSGLAGRVMARWVNLFMSFCCLPTTSMPSPTRSGEGIVRDAVMYLEAGWPSPVGCAMVYHRSPGSFARDFSQMLVHHREVIEWPRLLSVEGGQRSDGKRRDPQTAAHLQLFYAQFDDHTGAIMALLNGLCQADADRMEGLSDEEARRMLAQVMQTEGDVGFMDLGPDGGLLYTDPLSSVWRGYVRMLDAAPG